VTLRDKQVEIKNFIGLPSYDIRAIQIHFGEENSLTYEFTNPVRNGPLDEKLFEISEFDRKL
jgi:hypothetical protein